MTLGCGVVTKCRDLLTALYAGGAFLDYRNRDGLTPMHRAAEKGNSEAVKVCLIHYVRLLLQCTLNESQAVLFLTGRLLEMIN